MKNNVRLLTVDTHALRHTWNISTQFHLNVPIKCEFIPTKNDKPSSHSEIVSITLLFYVRCLNIILFYCGDTRNTYEITINQHQRHNYQYHYLFTIQWFYCDLWKNLFFFSNLQLPSGKIKYSCVVFQLFTNSIYFFIFFND